MKLFIYILILLPLLSFVRGGFSLAPWVPAKKEDLKRINNIAELRPGETFYELGCGDARVCHFIAKENPHAQVVGYEITWIMYLCAKIRLWIFPLPNLSVIKKDVFSEDLSKADVLYVFGMKESTKKLREMLILQPKKNRRLLSYSFSLSDESPYKKSGGEKQISIYSYLL